MAYCTKCGEHLRNDVKFCTACGATVRAKKEISASTQPRNQKRQKPKAKQTQPSVHPQPPRASENQTGLKARAIAKGLSKSLALSVVVLGPGILLLQAGATVPGMLWLFVGSFGMMAWTYRRPWHISAISCLTPPFAALLSFIAQIWIFSPTSPPFILIVGAVAAGIGVGYWRGQTHQVIRRDDGAVIAQRTVGYLLVWVVAYGITQMLGLLAADVFAIRAGLIIGAFSTVMLVVVSMVIWRESRKALGSLALLLVAGLAFLPTPSAHAGTTPQQICGRLTSELGNYLIQTLKQHGRSGRFSNKVPFTDWETDHICKGSIIVNSEGANSGLSIEINGPGKYRDTSRLRKKGYYQELEIEQLKGALYRFENNVIHSEPAKRQFFSRLMIETKYATIWIGHTDRLSSSAASRGESAGFNIVVKTALAILYNIRTTTVFSPPARKHDSSSTPVPPTPPIVVRVPQEKVISATVAISVILVLAGMAVQVANSIAAALAQALQAGAELTGSEIEKAVSKAIGQSKVDAVESRVEPGRPPGPTLYDKQGKPFERNDLGQYWAPNERGDWEWLDEGQAREASQALHDELEIRKTEQQFHDEETRRLLDKARREGARDAVQTALRLQAGELSGSEFAADETVGAGESLPEEMEPGATADLGESGSISSDKERLASATEQSEQEAGQLLGDLLEEDPEQQPQAVQLPKAPPSIPAVPTTMSDDRELPPDPDEGAKPAAQPKTQEQATPETTAAVHKAATRLSEEEPDGPAGTTAPAGSVENDPADTRLAEATAEATAEAEALVGDLLGEDAGTDATTDSPPEPTDVGSESSAETAEGESAQQPAEASPAPFRDPIDGTPLEVDVEGRVKYGEQWMSPEEAAHRVAMDQEWQRAQAAGQERIDRFKATLAELEQTSDPQARQRLEEEIRRQAIDMNGDYAAKTILKAQGRTDAGAGFDQAIHSVYDEVDDRFLGDLNEQGFRRGGREFTRQDVIEFRNAASAGTVGIDRDAGLDESAYREALEALQNAKPGSPEAQEALQRLAQARNQGRLTLDPEQHGRYLADRKGRLIEQAVAKRGQLATMLGQDPEAVKLREELGQLEGQIKEIDQRQSDLAKSVEHADALKQARIAELERTRNALPADSPARARIDQRIENLRAQKTIDMSPGRWNEAAQATYGEAYARTTGRSADEAMQVVTTGKHVEAFQDGRVLQGVSPDNLPDPRFAEQTASVSRIKDIENRHLAEAGHLTQGQALQETARGYAKDMATKVIPMLESDPKVVPEKLEQIRKMRDVFERAGRGEIPPGRIDGELRKAVPDIEGLTLQKATQIVDGRFQAAIQRQVVPEVPKTDFGAHLSTALDAEGVVNDFNRLRSEGLSVEDAAFVASAKAVVGAKMGEHLNPGISMAGAMLPEGSRKLLPDQFAGELIEEGHKALKGLVKDLAESTVSGEVNLEHFNAAAEKIGDGKGVIGDWAKVARFLGEEAARADQSNPDAGAFGTGLEMMGNLKDDLMRMHQTGALGEQLGEMKQQAEKYLSEDLAREALEGKHGVPLSGYAEAAKLAGEILDDPAEFGRDLQRMWQQGGDAELVTEMIQHTDKTLTNTPVAGTVYSGWKHLGDLATKAEKREEAFEGAQALAGEAYGWFNATSKSVARELHHRLFE